jgi:hypothetical protein
MIDRSQRTSAATKLKADIRKYQVKVCCVRKADIWAECSEGLLPAISTSGGVAAKLRFRVCSGGHAGAYGADVVKDISWILNK